MRNNKLFSLLLSFLVLPLSSCGFNLNVSSTSGSLSTNVSSSSYVSSTSGSLSTDVSSSSDVSSTSGSLSTDVSSSSDVSSTTGSLSTDVPSSSDVSSTSGSLSTDVSSSSDVSSTTSDNPGNDNLIESLGERKDASHLDWNTTYNLQPSSIYYQLTQDDLSKYYVEVDAAKNLVDLKEALHTTLKKGHIKLSYDGKNGSAGQSETWANYIIADRDWEAQPLSDADVNKTTGWVVDNVKMDLLYRDSPYTFKLSDASNTRGMDREHIYAKSYGFNGAKDLYKKLFAGCDMHHLYAADHVGNSTGHSNRAYDYVTSNNKSQAVAKDNTITYYDNDKNIFEPKDNDKGNIARAIFYMATRYDRYEENDGQKTPQESPKLLLSDTPSNLSSGVEPSYTKNNNVYYGVLSTLLKWHKLDPVDNNELTRNNTVYHLQGNRNPFIDYPDLADIIFGNRN